MKEKYIIGSKEAIYSQNKTAQVLKVISIINFVLTLMVGFVVTSQMYAAAATLVFFASIFMGILSSSLIWGVGEIVQLLHNLHVGNSTGNQIVKEIQD